MTAVALIQLQDAQGTPVTHNFVPSSQDSNGVWWYEDSSPSASVGYNRISLSLKKPPAAAAGQSSGNRVNRCIIRVYTPALETLGTSDSGLTPPPTVAFVDTATVEFVLPERDSLQNRKDLRAYLGGLLQNPQVVGMVESLQGVY